MADKDRAIELLLLINEYILSEVLLNKDANADRGNTQTVLDYKDSPLKFKGLAPKKD